MEINFTPKNAEKYFCKNCDFKCSKNSDWTRHLSTRKHKMEILEINFTPKNAENICNVCNKIYKTSSGLWKHKKTCGLQNENNILQNNTLNSNNNLLNVDTQNMILQILKQNQEFQKELFFDMQKQMLETIKPNNVVNNINNGSINNNQFNLQLFLNETCKDAMSIDDFINSLQPSIKDLEETGRLGYSAGITRIIVNGLKELDVSKRPIHCSDLKRETMFIKNTETWEKETEEKPILLKAIKEVGKKNIMNIKEWQKSNTHFNKYDSKQNDVYLQIVSNSMSGGTEEEQLANYNKIIKNIAKETIIDKNTR
jgi:hypothetical protein